MNAVARRPDGRSRRRLEAVLNSAGEGIIGLSLDGRIDFANSAAVSMLGWTETELTEFKEGEHALLHHTLPDGSPYPEAQCPMRQVMSDGVSRKIAGEVFWRKDGTAFVVEYVVTPMAEEGIIKGAVVVFDDITERMQVEADLRARTEALERSNAELQQFASVASHDLREPLRMIRNYLRLLEQKHRGHLDAEATEYIDFAVDGAQRLDALIHDLLELTRIGNDAHPFGRTAIKTALDAALWNLKVAVEESGATIKVPDFLPSVLGDDGELARLFQNLIGNAIKYRRPNTHPNIRIYVAAQNSSWRFTVRDNGIGIPAEDCKRIFGVFQRLHGRGEYEGTGIGLAICRKIVEHHGGRIWVESDLGKGSTFCFTLPKIPTETVVPTAHPLTQTDGGTDEVQTPA